MRIHFERSDATEMCGRAIMLQNGPNGKCPRKNAEDTNMAIIPNCRKLKGNTIIISGKARTSTLRCAGKAEETISLSIGTTTTPGECNLDTTTGQEKRNWQFHEPEKEEEVEYITPPIHPMLGMLAMKDLLIIGLATASILLSLGLGLAYIHFKRAESRNQLAAYENALRSQRYTCLLYTSPSPRD